MQTDDTFTAQQIAQWQPVFPRFRERIHSMLERQHFMKHIECRLERIDAGIVEARTTLSHIHHQQDGYVHGGVIATIADVAMGFASVTLIAEHQTVVTVDLMLSYLNAATGIELRSCAQIIRHGSTHSFARADIYVINSEQREQLVAIAQATFAIRDISITVCT